MKMLNVVMSHIPIKKHIIYPVGSLIASFQPIQITSQASAIASSYFLFSICGKGRGGKRCISIMDLQSPCSACIGITRKPPLPKHSFRRNDIKIGRKRSKTVSVAVNSDSLSPTVTTHKVTVHDRQRGVVHEFSVPEDQYILHSAEDQNITLPFACRHGCCTSCAVRVKSGQLRQPEALGISTELKSKGYALLCVGFPSSDLEVETQDEDEVYWLQFGRYFARGPIERDDYALELALGDE